jgi:hypothetical protein
MQPDKSGMKFGITGFVLALVPWITLVVTIACSAARVPGFG